MATVSYRIEGGASVERTTFVSRPDRVLIQKLSTDRPGTLSFNVYSSSPHAASQARPVDARTWMLSGRVGFGPARFVAAIRVLVEGARAQVETTPTGLRITDADQAIMFVSAATSYVAPGDLSGAPETTALNHLDAASERTAASLRERHLADFAQRYPSSGTDTKDAFAAYLQAAASSNPDTAPFWALSWNERLDPVPTASTGASALLTVPPP
jgi:alpha-L-fucosidase 2